MITINLKRLRLNKGLSQQELADRVYATRQTISKWEKGISVPDARMLIHLADVLEGDVSTILGETVKEETDLNEIALKLENLNNILSRKSSNSKFTFKHFIIAISLILLLKMLLVLVYITLSKISF